MERKRWESIRCWIHDVTLSYDLDLGLSRSNCEIDVCQEWLGRLTWNERDASRCVVDVLYDLDLYFTHDLELWFSRINFQIAISQEWNERDAGPIRCWTHNAALVLLVSYNTYQIQYIDLGMGWRNTVKVYNLGAHQWAVDSLSYGTRGVIALWTHCFC